MKETELQTVVDIPVSAWKIKPCARLLFVGSCFAANMGERFREDGFRVTLNPYGVMYNPVSVRHTIERLLQTTTDDTSYAAAVLTLGTNHIYILNETGEVVDNCEKRPQRLFTEQTLNVTQVGEELCAAIRLLRQHCPDIHVILTVSPIRYRKYGFHESQLSKATLLLGADEVVRKMEGVSYFPAYELINDELRDYRFYAPDMLHPSQQAVDYIGRRFSETYFAAETVDFLKAWQPLRAALAHRPLHPESEEYRQFKEKTLAQVEELRKKYPEFSF